MVKQKYGEGKKANFHKFLLSKPIGLTFDIFHLLFLNMISYVV
jgi:hypothetical protein